MPKVSVALSVAAACATNPGLPPLTSDEAVRYLNSNYGGWKDGDEQSSVGVVMRTAISWGFFCEGFKADTGCSNGMVHCTTSASILNDHVMLNNKDQLALGLSPTAIIFNTSVVETKLGRCTYQYDGGTFARYNRGCGGNAKVGPGMCKNLESAWFDIDPKTGTDTTDKSEVVLKDYCPNRKDPPTEIDDAPCYWKGPAWSKTGVTTKSETHKMMSQRIRNQRDDVEAVSAWNEVVIDLRVLLSELRQDPARVVLAMVYQDGGDSLKTQLAIKTAAMMAKDMQEEFNMDQPVPVVGVDTTLHIHSRPDVPGPFFNGMTTTQESFTV